MLNVGTTEAGSQPIITATPQNNLTAKTSSNNQTGEKPLDFLTVVFSKLVGKDKSGAEEGQENSGELNGLGKEGLALGSVECPFTKGQLGNNNSVDRIVNFLLESNGLKDQIEKGGEEGQEETTVPSDIFQVLNSLFRGKENILKSLLKKAGDTNTGICSFFLSGSGKGEASQSKLPLIDEVLPRGKEKGKDNPDVVNPKEERPVERASDPGVLLQKAGCNSGLNLALLFRSEQTPVTQSEQPPVDGVPVKEKGSGEKGSDLANPKRASEKPSDPGILLQDGEVHSIAGNVSRLSNSNGPAIQTNRSPAAGKEVSGTGSKEESPGLVKSEEKNPVIRPELNGSPDLKEGSNPGLDDNLLLNKLQTFVDKIFQSVSDESNRNPGTSEEEKSGFEKSIEHLSSRDNQKGEGLSAELIKIQPAQDKPSSNSLVTGRTEMTPSEKRKEGEPGLFTGLKEGSRDEHKGVSAVEHREGPDLLFDNKGLSNKELSPTGEKTQENGSRQDQNLPIGANEPIVRESVIAEKSFKTNPDQPIHFPKTSDADYLKDYSFSVKKQTSSSMEISLEPAGLGKLDIELNLNHDHLQGQIMVHDQAGKELIERNLPQLLSDLTRDGLQVGGFTVSLKNQGRNQTPVLTPTEVEEPSLRPVSPEKIVPIQGNHLIHIII